MKERLEDVIENNGSVPPWVDSVTLVSSQWPKKSLMMGCRYFRVALLCRVQALMVKRVLIVGRVKACGNDVAPRDTR